MNSTATLPSLPEPFGTATAVLLGEGEGGSGAGTDVPSGLAGTKGAAPLVTGVGAGASGAMMGAGAVPCSSRRVAVGSSVVHAASTANTTAASNGKSR